MATLLPHPVLPSEKSQHMAGTEKIFEFPACLVVRIPGFHCCGLDLISGGGTCNPQSGQKIKIKENVLEEKKKKYVQWGNKP